LSVSDVPGLDLPVTEDTPDVYRVTQQDVVQPESPVLHPQSRSTKLKVVPAAANPGPITMPELSIPPADGIPWWVWGLVLLALSKRRR